MMMMMIMKRESKSTIKYNSVLMQPNNPIQCVAGHRPLQQKN